MGLISKEERIWPCKTFSIQITSLLRPEGFRMNAL